MIEIKTQKIYSQSVSVPGSKSYTHRLLIAAALSDGTCLISHGLNSEDTLYTMNALKQMGIEIIRTDDLFTVHGNKGVFKSSKSPIYIGNSGTSMRLLTAVAALGQEKYIITGTKRMQNRPIQDLLDGLNQLGISAKGIREKGFPPVEICGGKIKGGKVQLNCETSSQFLSALLLIGPCTDKGIEINVIKGPVSRPYIDMTLDVMKNTGIRVFRDGYQHFKVEGGQLYKSGSYTVEPDCSQAGYFWAAAAITGSSIKVKGTTMESSQGDVRFTEILQSMGCSVLHDNDGIEVTGHPLSAIEADMADMPDMVPTLAVVASFAGGNTVIKNVAHLKAKESDRLGSVANELSKMGIEAVCSDTGMTIKGGKPVGAEIDTYNDHRIAMSFALAGLKTPGVFIKNEKCVEKSFPEFWKVFGGLYKTAS